MPQKTQQPLQDNIRLLGGMLGDTIRRFEGDKIFDTVEQVRRLSQKARSGGKDARNAIEKAFSRLPASDKYKVAKAFTQFLQLANVAEQTHRIRRRDAYKRSGAAPQRASPLDTFTRLQEQGTTAGAITDALRDIQIELVLTAHPTEAATPHAIRACRDLSALLLRLDEKDLPFDERGLVLREIRAAVIRLWLGGAVRDRKPTPVDEARYGLELTERILWRAVPHFFYQLSVAYKTAVGDMSQVFPSPFRFASWMGGDRDGHPGVTAKVTRRVLDETSGAAVTRYLAALEDLSAVLVFDKDARGIKLQKGVTQRITGMERKLRDFRQGVLAGKAGYSRDAFLADLDDLRLFIRENADERMAYGPLQDLIWRVRVFGLCFMQLDIRQSADVHENAVDDILGGKYKTLSESAKMSALQQHIRKGTKPRKGVSAQTAEVLDTLRLFETLPREFFGAYIISMAAQPSDILEAVFLLKAAGVAGHVPVCPLFETPESLENARSAMKTLYALPLYRRHVNGAQEIMLGYSDSAKRGGYVSAAWFIHQLQSDLQDLGRKNKIRTTFFHGRGGTIARGGGPIETALLALPRPHASHRIRATEQGEAIDAKFGLPAIAERTMELYLSGFLEAVLSKPEKKPDAWLKTMDRLSAESSSAFRAVVYECPEFLAHYEQLTPMQELSLLKIGSRPGRRKKGADLENLRAIPWVFGWTQSRTLLPAWLGIAEAIDAEIAAGRLKTLKDMYQGWPFFKSVIDLVEMAVAKADDDITDYYSKLLVEPGLQWLTKDYLQRLGKTRKALLRVTGQKAMLQGKPVLERSIRIRSPYVDVLNVLQAHLLKEYRAKKRPSRDLYRTLALTISGISAGMRNTG